MKKVLKQSSEIYSLTGLRFIAAFYVFLFHIHLRWPLTYNPYLKNIVGQGAIGMSLFFMLSGFVLAYRYTDLQTPWRDYLVNRFARIYPIYLVAAFVTIPWIAISFSGNLFEISRELGKLTLLVVSNIFLIQAWFPQFFDFWNNGGSWSISVEAFCYLMLPLLLPLLVKLTGKIVILMLIVFWLLAAIPGLSAELFGTKDFPIFYAMPIFRLPEFLIGVCIFLAMRLGYKSKSRAFAQMVVLGIFIGYLGLFGDKMPIFVGHNWITIPVIAFMIFSLANSKGFIAYLLSSRIFVWLGKISYCFYSFQVLLILFLIQYHDSIVISYPIFTDNRVLGLIAFMILIVMSTLGFYLIEEPARKWIRSGRLPKIVT